jgi:hypothetical protein
LWIKVSSVSINYFLITRFLGVLLSQLDLDHTHLIHPR